MPTNYHEYEYSKFSVFKLKFMTTGRIHASRWVRCLGSNRGTRNSKRDHVLSGETCRQVSVRPPKKHNDLGLQDLIFRIGTEIPAVKRKWKTLLLRLT